MSPHSACSEEEDEPKNGQQEQNPSKTLGASNFDAFSNSRTANWRDALLSDQEDSGHSDENDDNAEPELDQAALIAQTAKALAAAAHSGGHGYPASASTAPNSTSEADDALLEPAIAAAATTAVDEQPPSAPTSPETHHLSKTKQKRRVVQDSDESEDDDDEPAPSASASSHRSKLEALAAMKRAQLEQAAAQKEASRLQHEPHDELKVPVLDDDEDGADKPQKSKSGGGVFKGKDKAKEAKQKQKKLKGLDKAEYLAMKTMSAEQRLSESARIEPGQKRVFDLQDQLSKWRQGASKAENARSASNFKDVKAAQPVASTSAAPPPAPTPMERHAEQDHLEDSFPRDAYLQSQSQSQSQSQDTPPSQATPATTRARPPPTSHDTIQTSTSPYSAQDHHHHQPHYRKPALAMSRANSAQAKTDKEKDGSNSSSDEDGDDGTDLVNIDEWSKNFVGAQQAKRKALAAQKKQQQPTMMNAADDDESDSDLEIVQVEQQLTAGPSKRAAPQQQRPSMHQRKSSEGGVARAQLVFTDSQIHRAGKAWSAASAHRAAGPVDSRGLNAALLSKSHQQGRLNADKRRAEWHARGGRERKDKASQETSEESQQANVASLLQDLQQDAKDRKDEGGDEDEEEEEDADFVPDEPEGEDEGEPEEDDEETAELRAAGLLQEQAEDEDDGEEAEDVEGEEESANESGEDTQPEASEETGPTSTQQPQQSVSPRRSNGLSGPSFVSDTSDLSPTLQARLEGSEPAQAIQHNVGDLLGGQGFSQLFEDDFATQAPVASSSKVSAEGHDLFNPPQAALAEPQALKDYPRWFLSQGEKQRNYDRMENDARYMAAQEGIGGDMGGPKGHFLNSQGLLTQHAPVDSLSQPSFDEPGSERSQIPGADDSMLVDSDEEAADQDSQDEDKLRSLKEAARTSSPSQEQSSEAAQPLNAFEVVQQAQKSQQQQQQPAFFKEKRKKEKNAFVQDQADESDEDEGFMRGLRKNNDDEEEDNSDEEGSVEGLVDDQKVDQDLQDEQDERVHAKDQELAKKRDEAQQKEIEKVARGDWRHKKRHQIGDLSDSDFSDEEFGNKRAARNAKAKKRKLAGDGKDQMDEIANNPETQAFAQSYKETTVVEGKGEDYSFLQADEEDGSSDDEDERDARRMRERMDMYERQEQISRAVRQQERAKRGLEPDMDEYEEDDMYIKAVGSSSPPPAQSYNMKIKDRTTVVKATAKPMYRDSFEDIEAEYNIPRREESAHVRKLRAQEAIEGGGSSSSRHKGGYAKRAGQHSSITNMTRKQPGHSSKTAASISGLMKPQPAQNKSMARKVSAGDSAISLGAARKGGFRR